MSWRGDKRKRNLRREMMVAYLVYTTHGAQIVHDEKMEEFKRKKSDPAILARFPLSEAEARLTLDQLTKIYPKPIQEIKNGNEA